LLYAGRPAWGLAAESAGQRADRVFGTHRVPEAFSMAEQLREIHDMEFGHIQIVAGG